MYKSDFRKEKDAKGDIAHDTCQYGDDFRLW